MKKILIPIYILLLLSIIVIPPLLFDYGGYIQLFIGILFISFSLFAGILFLIASIHHNISDKIKFKGYFLRLVIVGLGICLIGILVNSILSPTLRIDRKIPPVKYENIALKDILNDIATTKAERVDFNIYGEDLANRKISIETHKPTSLKAVMDLISKEAKCQYKYGHCGTCGALLGGITLYDNPDYYKQNSYPLYIRGRY